MKQIRIPVSIPYDVLVGNNILPQSGKLIRSLPSAHYTKIALIADNNVASLYGETVTGSLEESGFQVLSYIFPAGESSKSADQLLHLLSWLVQHNFTRSDLLIALGGGVTGDLVGFAASIYLRGCDFIQIPTTLLAAVDSSVGGKTAINIPEGKNLVGSFWQPRLVLCDIDTFFTLTPQTFADGVAEMIKYGCIWDEKLFVSLQDSSWKENMIETISRCISIKAEVVMQDERDNGLRQILNFGHTVAHAIEILSDLSITHGQAVSIGMCIISKSLEQQGKLPPGTEKQITSALRLYNLPISTTFTAKQLADKCLNDKKRAGDTISIIGLEKIGQYKLIPLPVEELEAFIERGL